MSKTNVGLTYENQQKQLVKIRHILRQAIILKHMIFRSNDTNIQTCHVGSRKS